MAYPQPQPLMPGHPLTQHVQAMAFPIPEWIRRIMRDKLRTQLANLGDFDYVSIINRYRYALLNF
jgi:hypothetical protein